MIVGSKLKEVNMSRKSVKPSAKRVRTKPVPKINEDDFMMEVPGSPVDVTPSETMVMDIALTETMDQDSDSSEVTGVSVGANTDYIKCAYCFWFSELSSNPYPHQNSPMKMGECNGAASGSRVVVRPDSKCRNFETKTMVLKRIPATEPEYL